MTLTIQGQQAVQSEQNPRKHDVSVEQRILAVLDAACAWCDSEFDHCIETGARLDQAVDDYRDAIGYKRPARTKACTKCGREFPQDTFPISVAAGRPYRRGWCRSCFNAYFREFKRKKAEGQRNGHIIAQVGQHDGV